MRRGFTLVELLVVIAIIGLITSIVLVNLQGTRQRGRVAAGKQFSSQLQNTLGLEAVGIWRFNEGSGTTAYDNSGYGKNGTITGASWETEDGCGLDLGTCISFDGVNDFIEAGQVLNTNKTLPFTMAAWAKANSGGIGNWRTIVGTNSSFAEIAFSPSNNARFGQNGGGGWWQSGGEISADAWYHIVGVYDGANASLYVNGVLVSGPMPRTFTSNHGITLMGRYSVSGGEWMNGSIDDVHIFASAFTTAQVRELYAAGAPRYGLTFRSLLHVGLVSKPHVHILQTRPPLRAQFTLKHGSEL